MWSHNKEEDEEEQGEAVGETGSVEGGRGRGQNALSSEKNGRC